MNATQMNATQMNATQMNATQMNATQMNATQMNFTRMNAEQRPPTGRLPEPPRPPSPLRPPSPPCRPAPLAVTGPRSIRRVLHELCAGARREWVMVLDQATEAYGAGERLPAAPWPGAELRTIDGVVLVRHAVPAGPWGPAPEQGPLRLVVVDRSAALIPLHPGTTFADGALLVRDPAVTASMHAMCATLWQQARPLPPADSGPPPGLLPVLDVLLQGLTDAAAAKRLGVSARTYSRRVAQLLRALGVTSRAQAGAAALARGWITSAPS